MLTLVNFQDYTDLVTPKSIKINQSLSQPISTAAFKIIDKGAAISIKGLQEVVILDENGLVGQTINLLLNPNLDINAGDSTVVWYWPIVSTLAPAPTITYTPTVFGASTLKFDTSSCTTVGTYFYTQTPLLGHIVAGQTYTFSAAMTRTGLTSTKGVLQIQYLDTNGAVLATFTKNSNVNGSSTQSITGLAPANTMSALISFGVQTIATTPSGFVTFSNLQFEPQMLGSRGVTYPTPVCNHTQANCNVLPNGTTVRQSRLFAGYVSRTSRSYAAKYNRRWSVECFSNLKLLDATPVSGLYAAGMTDGQIIASLLAQPTYAVHPILGTPLITGHNVVGSTVMPLMAWDNIPLLQALQDICDITGATFYLDWFFDLHYFPWQYNTAGFSLSDAPDNMSSFAYADFVVDEDASQPKNRVVITGGTYYPTWVDPFTGDGSTKQFTLTQAPPQTMLSLTVAGVAKKVGINGQNTFSQGYDALMDVNGHFILFNVAPASASAILATYTYATPLRTRAWDLNSIDSTYGIAFGAGVSDNSIIDQNTALQRGIGELESFAYGRGIYHLTTQKAVLPGQVVPITSVAESMTSQPLLIQQVAITPQGGGLVTYAVDLGAYDPDLIALIKAMHQQTQPTTQPGTVIATENIAFAETQTLSFSDSSSVTNKASATYFYGNSASTYGYSTYS